MCVSGCDGSFFYCNVPLQLKFNSDKIDLNGRLLYFNSNIKIDRGTFHYFPEVSGQIFFSSTLESVALIDLKLYFL